MSSSVKGQRTFRTVAELQKHLGGIATDRIRLMPSPGQATDFDLQHLAESESVLCELVRGTLVEKPMGAPESYFTTQLLFMLMMFNKSIGEHGEFYGPDVLIRFHEDTIRLPDIAFYKWDRYPNRLRPNTPILDIIPNLVVEVLSPSNTSEEMAQKRRDYFDAGVELVWIVDMDRRNIEVWTSPIQHQLLTEADRLTGGDVLPGLSVSLVEIFSCLDRRHPPS